MTVSKVIPLLQFFFVRSVVSYVEFVLSLFVPYLFNRSPSFGTSGGLCFVNMAFLEYLHLARPIFRSDPVNILHKSIAGRYRPVRVADGPITARCR